MGKTHRSTPLPDDYTYNLVEKHLFFNSLTLFIKKATFSKSVAPVLNRAEL
jgi:hypothetical protein